jgi:hypothetical protein
LILTRFLRPDPLTIFDDHPLFCYVILQTATSPALWFQQVRLLRAGIALLLIWPLALLGVLHLAFARVKKFSYLTPVNDLL